jgi:hypothetical protein
MCDSWLTRRFAQPLLVKDMGAAYIVKDSAGQNLAFVYYANPGWRWGAGNLLTKDEAQQIAASIAKLPELLGLCEAAGAIKSQLG